MFYIIPDISDISKTIELTTKYNLGWEYNDFTLPDVYDKQDSIDAIIDFYIKIDRDRSMDTMHGAFLGLDITATDTVIRERSRHLIEQSVSIANRLGIKGVVFHTGLVGGLRLKYYIDAWVNNACTFYTRLCSEYPDVTIYIENSFEQEPDALIQLMERMVNVKNFKICFDYAHAILTKTPIEIWCEKLAPYIGHMHLNDNDLVDDLHLAPGKGKIDFDEWKRLMEKYHIDTSVLIELKGYEEEKQALEFLL